MRTIEALVQKHESFIDSALRDRLYNSGTYADGKPIKTFKATNGVYSNFTIKIKAAKGQPTDRVTLNDTGRLYESFNLNAGNDSFVIDYDDNKTDGNVSDNIPELQEAIKLGDNELTGLQQLIKTDLQDDFIKESREAILYGFR